VIEEELVTGTQARKTGSVRVTKTVEQVTQPTELTGFREIVQVNRVPVNSVVSSMPQIREEGETLIVPVVEEEVIIEKRLVLKEEIHLLRQRVPSQVPGSVTLGRERVRIERLDAEGNVIDGGG